ncbi:MAG: RibD family protein, partial [Nannocystaceae bacterium]
IGNAGGVEATACHGLHGEAAVRVLARMSAGGRRRRARILALSYATDEVLAHLPACRRAGVTTLCVGVDSLSRRAAAQIRRAGIQLRRGVERARAHALHRDLQFASAHGRPWVTLKAAISLDGMMACANGASQWITGEASRREGHRLRATHDAIAVGAGTVRADDPRLTVRHVRGKDPRIVIFDSALSLVGSASKFHALCPGTIVIHGGRAAKAARARAVDAGLVPVRVRTTRSGLPDVRDALRHLAGLQVRSLMVEGGGALLASFYQRGVWEEIQLFSAPKLLGGASRPLLPMLSWAAVDRAPALRVVERRVLGEDFLTVLAPSKSQDR